MKKLLRQILHTFLLIYVFGHSVQANSIENANTIHPQRYIYPIAIQIQTTNGWPNFAPKWLPGISCDILCMHNAMLKKLDCYPRFGLSTYFYGKYKTHINGQYVKVKPLWAIATYMELDKFYNRKNVNSRDSNLGNKIAIGFLSHYKGYSLILSQELLCSLQSNTFWEWISSIGFLLKTAVPKKNLTSKNEPYNKLIVNKYYYLTQSIRFTCNRELYLEKKRQIMQLKRYQCSKKSRVDTSLMVNSRYNSLTTKYDFPFRLCALYSIPLDYYTGWISSMELSYGVQKTLGFKKKAMYKNTLSINLLTGIEFRYKNLLLQHQIGLPCGDFLIEDFIIVLSSDLQIKLSKCFFIGVNLRHKELPGFRVGISL